MTPSIRRGGDLPERFDGWLWENTTGLIPRNDLTLIVGHDGTGKSQFVLSLVAEWTAKQGETVFLSMQEDSDAITKGRLAAYGADLERTVFQPARSDSTPEAPWTFPKNVAEFAAYLWQTKATVAVIDSLDVHVDNLAAQVARQTLNALRTVAQRLNVTIILVGHVNKTGRSLDAAIGGGRGIKAAMRCILVWGERPQSEAELFAALFSGGPLGNLVSDDELDETKDEFEDATHALAVHKNSYGQQYPHFPTALFRSEKLPYPYQTLGDISLLKFEYVNDAPTISPHDIWHGKLKQVRAAQAQLNQRDRARDMIIRFLAAAKGDWMPATELLAHVMAAGIAERTVTGAVGAGQREPDREEAREQHGDVAHPLRDRGLGERGLTCNA